MNNRVDVKRFDEEHGKIRWCTDIIKAILKDMLINKDINHQHILCGCSLAKAEFAAECTAAYWAGKNNENEQPT